MKISIITPTHNPKFLHELAETIFTQTYTNWEWIILTNNEAVFPTFSNEKIRIVRSKQNTSSVGALKKEACSLATGEIIVEVDHDDLITENCLEEIANAFSDNNIGFVYSDNAKLSDSFIPYDPQYGWQHYKYNFKGRELFAMKNQPLTPGRLGYIWFAPDHVRAWRKSVYDSIGGHNPELHVCDDLDLIHRLYLVTQFKYIEKVLYIYRINGENTWIKNSELIQNKTVEIYNTNIYALAERFSQLNGLLNIDLCGAFNKPKNFISIDVEGSDIIHDLNKGIPLADNSCGIVRAHDALEHIADKMMIMQEIHRVLAPGGILLSSTPSTDGRGAFQDPTHVSFWNENSFWYYTRNQQAAYIRNTKHLFRECSLFTWFPSEWHKQHNICYVQAHLEKIP
jgi:glycosyltransferase involved in cell wall biosynthesis